MLHFAAWYVFELHAAELFRGERRVRAFHGPVESAGCPIARAICGRTRRTGSARHRIRHGGLALAAARVAPSAPITGVDPSASYVSYAQRRAPSERVRFVVGDAQALQMPDASFDRVVSLFVMNFIPDRAKALREMIRVTRPDGVIAAAVWDYGDGMQMLRVFWDEAVALDPAVAARDERNMPLCRRGELAALWREHGLAQVEEQPLTIRMSFSSFEDYWEPFLGGQGPAGAYVASLSAARRDALRNRIRQRLVGNGPDRPIAAGGASVGRKGRSTARPRRSQAALDTESRAGMLRWLALLVFVCACGSSQPPVGADRTALRLQQMDESRVLMVTANSGFRHDSIPSAVQSMRSPRARRVNSRSRLPRISRCSRTRRSPLTTS